MIEIQYPAIMVWKNGIIWIGRTHNELFFTAMNAYKKGLFKDAMVIDSKLKVRIITGIDRYVGSGIFGGYNLYLNRRIIVYPKFGEIHEIDLLELRNIIKKLCNKGIYRSGDNCEENIQNIDIAMTFEEVFIVLDNMLHGPRRVN